VIRKSIRGSGSGGGRGNGGGGEGGSGSGGGGGSGGGDDELTITQVLSQGRAHKAGEPTKTQV
jgi:hypothetical protein